MVGSEERVKNKINKGIQVSSPISDQENDHLLDFPLGLRALVVDHNIVCLKIHTALLRKCDYQVIAEQNAAEGINLLKRNEEEFDFVVTGICMYAHETQVFKLLETGRELNIPVIVVSAYENTNIMMKAIEHGACEFLLKPLTMNQTKILWQHVFRKKLLLGLPILSHQKKMDDTVASGSDSIILGHAKKERFVWSHSVHEKFVDAVEKLGGMHKAVPRKILAIIDVPGVTREQVASHLQKYRKTVQNRPKIDHKNNKDK